MCLIMSHCVYVCVAHCVSFCLTASHNGSQPATNMSHCASLCLAVPYCQPKTCLVVLTISHYFVLWLVVSASHCASLCLTVPHCASLCLTVSHYDSLRLTVPHCVCDSLSLLCQVQADSLCLAVAGGAGLHRECRECFRLSVRTNIR